MKVKITNIFPENVRKTIGKRVAVIAISGVLALNLVCCGGPSISERNAETYDFEPGQTYFSSYQSHFSDDDVSRLPESIETISLDYALYLSDLSELPDLCPNLKRLTLDNCPSLDDISFIYRLPNLEYLSLNDCAFVTPELIQYLDEVGIEHNITQSDLDAAMKTDQIIDEIITEDMTDEEKIQAITFYVIDNYKYRVTKVMESNEEPLESMFENKGGVCASYAYLTNVLLRKAGIASYEIVSESHGWNLIELDGKYYYLDATNIKQVPIICKYVLKYFNVGFYYMQDPDANMWSAMEDYHDTDKVIIPQSLIEDIERGESEKNIWEKYGNSMPSRLIEIALMMAAIGGGFKLASTIKENASYRRSRKRRRR